MTGAPLTVLVVDDVALARQRLERLLGEYPDVKLVGSCADADAAELAIAAHKPDLVLLDIDMPGRNAFDLLERLPPDGGSAVVFATAHAEFAIRAFRVQALDYLLKPVDAADLREALNRAWARRRGGEDAPAYLVLRERDGTTVLSMAAIDWIESAGNYVCIRADGRTHIYRETLARLEARLDPSRFQRVHRSRIVNIARIVRLLPLCNGDHKLILQDGTELGLSRTWRNALFARMGQHTG